MQTLLFLILTLCAFYACVILFFRQGLGLLKPGTNTHQHRFSVVIAARNEEALLGRCLESVLEQDYPDSAFEVIVVNDRSTDGTAGVIARLMKVHSNLKSVDVTVCPEGVSPKKNALAQGLETATGEIILFTDADCTVSRSWISTMNCHFHPETGAVAGLTTYHMAEGVHPALFGIQAVDFFSHAVVSAAAIGAGLPINTNANNFAVRKSFFEEIKGYARVKSVVSGDDDLILQAVSRSEVYTIDFAIEKTAGVTTEPSKTIRQIWEQRKRWSSKTVYYNPKQMALLSGVFAFYFFLCLGFLLSPLTKWFFTFMVMVFVIKTALDFLLFYRGVLRFRKKELLAWFAPTAFIHMPLIVFACLFGIFGKFSWKDGKVGRKVRPVPPKGAARS